MKPLWYVTIRVKDETFKSNHGHSSFLLATAAKVIHAVALRHEFQHACAFPSARMGDRPHPGKSIRVFTQTREQCDLIADEIESHFMLGEGVDIDRVRSVTEEDRARSISYSLFRVKSLRDEKPQLRLRKMEEGNRLPFLKANSTSNGYDYSIRFSIAQHDEPASEEIQPNSYGLCVSSRPFRLPMIAERRRA